MFVKAVLPSGRRALVTDHKFKSHRDAHNFVLDRTRDGRLAKRFGIRLVVTVHP